MAGKRLYRSRDDRMLGGVCAGLAQYLDLDPSLLRIGVALGALFGWFGPLGVAYLVLWVVIPLEP